MGSWISMNEACDLLGVRPQTIYAYVSRGKVEVITDPADTRRILSLCLAAVRNSPEQETRFGLFRM